MISLTRLKSLKPRRQTEEFYSRVHRLPALLLHLHEMLAAAAFHNPVKALMDVKEEEASGPKFRCVYHGADTS